MSEQPPEARILIAAGARAAESVLMDAVGEHVAASRSDPRVLARPVRIVVPSQSLRQHVSAALVRRFGAVAGVQVQTLRSLALEVLERAGAPMRAGDRIVPLLVRSMARREAEIASRFATLRDGFGALVAPVKDLLDAGLTEAQLPAVLEAVAALPLPDEERERVAGLVRVAGRATVALDVLGIDTRSVLLRRALAVLERNAEVVLPRRALFVHGFADATGVATDVLVGLLRLGNACVVVDRPPDPADPARPDPGETFLQRFLGRLSVAARVEEAGLPAAAPSLSLRRAPGTAAEVRGVACDVRVLLDGGTAPESIGVVARMLGPFRAALREQFTALGIPFTVTRPGEGRDGIGRRFRALLDVLERGAETPTDRWLDALVLTPDERVVESDLRLGLHVLGAARLFHVADVPEEQIAGGVALPVARAPEAAEEAVRDLARRRVSGPLLRRLVARARVAREAIGLWPFEDRVGAFLDRVEAFAVDALGWSADGDVAAALAACLQSLRSELPMALDLQGEERFLLLRDAFAEIGAAPPGGRGAGVAVLEVVEARGRTFDHLFVVGLNRDVFPRVVLEDPLFPDAARAGLVEQGRGILADLPLKLGGFDEERYLFAQLLSASPDVRLSWQALDDEGRERAPSTLVERLRLARPELEVETLRTPFSAAEGEGVRSPVEHAVRAALHDSRAALERILPFAVSRSLQEAAQLARRAGASLEGHDAASLSESRLAALSMLEPQGGLPANLGPGLGLVGPRRRGDGEGRLLSVTLLESIARCPWRAYLTRVLRLEPVPDALDGLPDLDPLLVGSALHRVVERIVKEGLGDERRSLEEARERGARPVPWPSNIRLREIVEAESEVLLREEGRYSPGLTRVLVARLQPLLAEVFERLWKPHGPAPHLLGAELRAEVPVEDDAGVARTLAFRADLVSAGSDGSVITDLKTGAPISRAKKEPTRRKHLVAAIARGQALQAAAYARAGEEGRYAFIDPARSRGFPLSTVRADDSEVRQAFDAAVRTLLAVWDEGAFFPRLVLPEGVSARLPCHTCEVREACAHGDSGARRRLTELGAAEAGDAGLPVLLDAARRGFMLPAAKGAPDGSVEDA